MQRLLTDQRQTAARTQLHEDIMALPAHSPRRRAWLQTDIGSRQLCVTRPDHDMELSDQDFSEMFTTYLGVESADFRQFTGESIPCSTARADGDVTCDPYGFAIA